MALLPDKGRLVFSETNVDAPGGLKVSSCYDLALYPEMGSSGRGVLVVTVIGSIKFAEGKSSAGGTKLSWTAQERSDFISGVQAAIANAWSDQHRIKTPSTVPNFNDVGVLFDLRLGESLGLLAHSHWDVTATKVDTWTQSCVDPLFSTWVSNGEAHLDSLDLRPENKVAAGTQRGAVHEFGHMLGYRDEYPAARDNTSWVSDSTSIMHSCEAVQARHYAFFADWLTKQYKVVAGLAKTPIDWKVDGTIALVNAQT
jgi:hypothetical protein